MLCCWRGLIIRRRRCPTTKSLLPPFENNSRNFLHFHRPTYSASQPIEPTTNEPTLVILKEEYFIVIVSVLHTHTRKSPKKRPCVSTLVYRPTPSLSPTFFSPLPIPPPYTHTHQTRRQGPFSFDTSVPHPLASSCVFLLLLFSDTT